MSDLWKDIPEKVEFHLRSSASSPEDCEAIVAEVAALLADADALLRYYRAAEAYIPLAEYGGGVSRDVGADVVQTIMDEYAAACDALTEHLKGE